MKTALKPTSLIFLLSILLVRLAAAQSVPSLINYQGKLTDAAGNALAGGIYGVAFKIWTNKVQTSGEQLIWGQEFTNVIVLNGLFNVILGGGGNPVPGSLTNDLAGAFNGANRFIGLTVTKGTNGAPIAGANEIVPRQQILSAPYAFQANFATTAQNVINGTPAGAITPFAGSASPSGWLLCNGAAVSRSAYADLFLAIGTTYGSGDGSTTFNLPNYGGRTLIGAGMGGVDSVGRPLTLRSLGQTGGEEVHQLIEAEMPRHKHTISAASGAAGSGNSGGDQGSKDTSFAGGDQPHNNMQPFAVVNYLIKY